MTICSSGVSAVPGRPSAYSVRARPPQRSYPDLGTVSISIRGFKFPAGCLVIPVKEGLFAALDACEWCDGWHRHRGGSFSRRWRGIGRMRRGGCDSWCSGNRYTVTSCQCKHQDEPKQGTDGIHGVLILVNKGCVNGREVLPKDYIPTINYRSSFIISCPRISARDSPPFLIFRMEGCVL